MPGRKNPSLKDPEFYDELRADGASQQKAARISNAGAQRGRSNIARKGGEAGSYENWTVPDLKQRAKELGLRGYSNRRKAALIEMLREH